MTKWAMERFKSHQKSIQKWLSVWGIFYLISLGIRIPSTTGIEALAFTKMLFCSGICLSMALFVWNFSRKAMAVASAVILLYVAIPYIKVLTRLHVFAEEFIAAYCFGAESIGCLLAAAYMAKQAKRPILARMGMGSIRIVYMGIVWVPLVILGYFSVSGCLITGDILLTLFQTNAAEMAAYVQDRGILLWGTGLFGLLGISALFIKLFNGLSKVQPICLYQHDSKKIRRPLLGMIVVVLAVSLRATMYNMEKLYPYALVKTTVQTLQSYREYGQAKELRKERLASLHHIDREPAHGGVYVVVIGESETRDHMQVYGYARETTPWLTSFAGDQGTIIFSHAYSNHTHTVPALTYALSEKNQYNHIDLAEAYSILETAKAAGYTTYWLSNQQKYGTWDTPIAEIASTADYEVWLNGNVGEQITTGVYDEKLAEAIPPIQPGENVLMMIHLMGCHGSYQERYPLSFQAFTGGISWIDEYDNSVLYNDFVLQQIYNTVKNLPDFQAFIYISDHGEDVEHNAGHESTKFSWPMAHIPFIVYVSDSFAHTNPATVQAMKCHQDAYWTNDLLYDVLLDLLGIQGTASPAAFDIASAAYQQDQRGVKTLHGKKIIVQEKSTACP